MKTKTTIQLMILAVLFSFSASAQTYVYNETTASGIFFQGTDGAEVNNPVQDDVNSTATCAMSSTDGDWQQIQFFPSFTPSSGDKLYFSVYNPNDVGPGQVQFEYASAPGTWQYGADVTYEAASLSGWEEYSVNLSDHIGEEINKIVIMPAGPNSSAVYIDNMYFNDESVSTPPTTETMYVYNEDVSSGIFFQGSGAEVANPVSDDVNSSVNCAMSSTDGNWQQIQFFPVFTPNVGDKLFFSVYNPDNAGPGQIQFEYTSDPGNWQWGDNATYDAESVTGWVEYSINLDDHAGNEINKIVIMPAGDSSSAVYVDNVYFGEESTLSVDLPQIVDEFVFIDTEGRVSFENNQDNIDLFVYDISGRLIFRENLNGKKSENNVNNRGIYIMKVMKGNRVSGKKLFFR